MVVKPVVMVSWLAVPAIFLSSMGIAQNSTTGSNAPSEGSSAPGGGQEIQEIVVTARKRDETLVNVPVQITVISGTTLEQTGSAVLTDVGKLASQVMLINADSGAGGASFVIRGVGGASVQDGGLEQSVNIVIDGVPTDRGRIATASLFDEQQVEVLKGPQALYFGKNSSAGVVSIKTADPGETNEGYLHAGYEFDADERYVEGAVSVPVSDTFSVRIAGRASEMDGYLINLAKPEPYVLDPALTNPGAATYANPHEQQWATRFTALWKPSDFFKATLKLTGSKYNNDSGMAWGQGLLCYPGQVPVVLGHPLPTQPCEVGRYVDQGTLPPQLTANWPYMRNGQPFYNSNLVLSSLNMEANLGPVLLTSVTGYTYIDFAASETPDDSQLASIWAGAFENSHIFNEEVRASTQFNGPLNFMGGAYFESARIRPGVQGLLLSAAVDPATGRYYSWANVGDQDNKTYSLFAQARWSIRDDLELSGGARWTNVTKRGSYQEQYTNPNVLPFGIFVPTGTTVYPNIAESNVSPEATLAWHPVADTTIFGAYKTGYKSGGISNPTLFNPIYTASKLEFKPEKATGGEVGAKGLFFGRTVRLELTAYRYKYSDLQVTSFNATTNSFLTENAASALIQGVEGVAEWKITPHFSVNTSVGFNRARYTSYPNGPCGQLASLTYGPCANGATAQDLTGKPLADAPDWSGIVGADYNIPLTSDLILGISADVTFTSAYYTFPTDEPVIGVQNAFHKLDASTRLSSTKHGWEVALIGRNLTNRYTQLFSNDATFASNQVTAPGVDRPWEAILQLSQKF